MKAINLKVVLGTKQFYKLAKELINDNFHNIKTIKGASNYMASVCNFL